MSETVDYSMLNSSLKAFKFSLGRDSDQLINSTLSSKNNLILLCFGIYSAADNIHISFGLSFLRMLTPFGTRTTIRF